MPVLVFILLLVLVAGAFFISAAFIYSVFIKPYIKTAVNRKLLLRYFLVFCIIAWGSAGLAWYFLRGPDFFEQGIDQLHESQYIQKKIGDFNSYSYYSSKFPKNPTKSAVFQVEILGDSLHLYLSCTMNKIDEKWKLVDIKEDSVKKVIQ